MGDIDKHLLKYEKVLNNPYDTSSRPLAKTMMTFMVKGLFTDLQFPYAFFPCCEVSNDLLWECIFRLEKCGVKVLFVTADGASTNRALFQKHDSSSSMVYKVPNKYADDRNIYFFSDPPQLTKTTRNCWASQNRKLMVCLIAYKYFFTYDFRSVMGSISLGNILRLFTLRILGLRDVVHGWFQSLNMKISI